MQHGLPGRGRSHTLTSSCATSRTTGKLVTTDPPSPKSSSAAAAKPSPGIDTRTPGLYHSFTQGASRCHHQFGVSEPTALV